MALIVEDGSIVTGAESYISVSDADAYHASRGITLWATMSEAEREQALRRATDYMVQAYRSRWLGYKVRQGQALDWPRAYVVREDALTDAQTYYPDDEVPTEVKNACAELAYRGAAGPLYADETRSQHTVREKVDVIEVEYKAWAPSQTSFRAVEAMLMPFLASSQSGAMRKLSRV